MSRDYAFNRIKEALRIHKGNSLKARQQIIAWTYEDAKLLHALTRPHLTGIVAYAIDKFQRKAHDEETRQAQTIDSVLDTRSDENFGKDLLRSLASGNSEIFGEESNGAPRSRSQASKRHEDAMRMLARKNKRDSE